MSRMPWPLAEYDLLFPLLIIYSADINNSSNVDEKPLSARRLDIS